MPNQAQSSNTKKYDPEERTALFGEKIIKFVRVIKVDHMNKPIITQLVSSSTGIVANYCEADGAESKKDFQHKIGICKKESKATKHWIRMFNTANSESKIDCRKFW